MAIRHPPFQTTESIDQDSFCLGRSELSANDSVEHESSNIDEEAADEPAAVESAADCVAAMGCDAAAAGCKPAAGEGFARSFGDPVERR